MFGDWENGLLKGHCKNPTDDPNWAIDGAPDNASMIAAARVQQAIKARHSRIDKIADHLRRLEFPLACWEPGTEPVLDKIEREAKELLALVEKRAAVIVNAFDAEAERGQAELDAEWEQREQARFEVLKGAGLVPDGITSCRDLDLDK